MSAPVIYCDAEYRQDGRQLILFSFLLPSGEWADFDFRDATRPGENNPATCAALQSFVRDWCARGAIWLSFAAMAEISAMLTAGVDIEPMRWICLLAEGRQITSSHAGFRVRPRETNLLSTLRAFGIPTRGDPVAKKQMVATILATDQYDAATWAALIDYCHSDVEPLPALRQAYQTVYAQAQLSYDDLPQIARGDYLKASARLEATSPGFPIDSALLHRIYANKQTVMIALASDCNAIYGPVYRLTPQGGVHFHFKALREHIAIQPITPDWETTPSGRLKMESEYLSTFVEKNPFYKPLRDCYELLHHLSRTDLRPLVQGDFLVPTGSISLPFHTGTSRNQPMVSNGFILNMRPWMRSLVRPQRDHVILAADWAQQEIWLSAALSGDTNLRAMLETGDVYTALAKRAKAMPDDGTKTSHPVARQTFKTCLAAGTRVVTQRGAIPIETIQPDDILWDGIEWVNHEGLLDQGHRATVTVSGVSLTPDHRVLCGSEWQEAQTLAHPDGSHCLRSALSAASWPSPAMWLAPVMESRRFSSPAPAADLSTRSMSATSAASVAHAVRPAAPLPPQRRAGGIIETQWPMTAIATDCSIAWPPRSPAATLPPASSMSTMVSAASRCTPNGGTIAAASSAMCRPFQAGMTRISRWIASIRTATTSRATSALSPPQPTAPTNAASPTSNSVSGSLRPVFDLANAGPRRRFTILTDDGPLIVSNCALGVGYGMQWLTLGHTIHADLRLQAIELHLPLPHLDACIETAREILAWHRAEFSQFWEWSERTVWEAKRYGSLRTVDGWTTFADQNSSPTRLGNFPVQGNAAAILRQSIKALARSPVKFLCSLHDAVLIYCHQDDAVEHENHLRRAMTIGTEAVMGLLPMPLPIPLEVTTYGYAHGYQDKRDVTTLPRILSLLDAQGL